MDRLSRSIAMCSFGLLLVAPGCKLTRPEVPPGRPFGDDGRQRPPLSFSSEGHPVSGAALTNIVPDSPGANKASQAANAGAGLGRPNDMAEMLGGPGGSFGPPGTSGRSGDGIGRTEKAPSADDEVAPAATPGLPSRSIETAPAPDKPPAGMPDMTTADTSAASARPSAPDLDPVPTGSQVIAPDPATAGTMGRASELPSPN